jgi:hypothetical protein
MVELPFRAETAKATSEQANAGAPADANTDAYAPFEIEHDFSLLQSRSRADTILKSGAAALLTGIGIGAAAYGISFAIQPEIIHDTKIVTETKVQRVEIEKPIVTEKVVEVSKIIDRPVAAAPPPQPVPAAKPQQASPPPAPGQRMSKGEFQNTQFFREADKCKGVLVSHVNGVMVFQNGSRCYDAYPDGGRDPRLTTSRNDGDLVSCNETGEQFPNGKPHWRCYALHNGVIESVRDFRTASTIQRSAPPSDDPFSDLFQ